MRLNELIDVAHAGHDLAFVQMLEKVSQKDAAKLEVEVVEILRLLVRRQYGVAAWLDVNVVLSGVIASYSPIPLLLQAKLPQR
jgi:hypothetical protein